MDYRAILFRLYPSEEQLTMLNKTAGCCRFIYNRALAFKKEKYEKSKKNVTRNQLDLMLPNMKKKFPFLSEVDSTSLQQSLRNLDTAYQNFFKHGRGFPKFKSKYHRQSFRVMMSNKIDIDYRQIKIGKLKWITARGSFDQYNGERIINITVSKETTGNWYASVLIEKEVVLKGHAHKFESCGIDVGVKKPLTVTYFKEEEHAHKFMGIKYQDTLAKKEKRRKWYQKCLARKTKGSSNRVKAKHRVSKSYQSERQYRRNWVEQSSNIIAKNFHTICIENLKLANMTRSCKGTIEEPGVNVSAKSGLNRELLRIGIGKFYTRVEDKAYKYGGIVVRVPPQNTSRACNECGCISKLNRKSQSRFVCIDCNHKINADVNAGRNIHSLGLMLAA